MSTDEHPQTLASDRRVLTVATIAMVGFVTIGVVSAQLFATSACRDITPSPTAPRTVVPDELPASLSADIAALAEHLGTAERAWHTTATTGISRSDDGSIAVLGRGALVVADEPVASDFDAPTRLVGDGASLYAVALINELTGQVDAVAPLDHRLRQGDCLDTAVVGSPFAFLLDAADGHILLLRVEEDAAAPEVELRDANGRVYSSRVEVPVAPPGVLAERVSGIIGGDVVVIARRAVRGDGVPVVVVLDRATGEAHLALYEHDLGLADEIVWTRPVAVVDDVALVELAGEDALEATLIGVDITTGVVRWRTPIDGRVDDADTHGALALVGDGVALVHVDVSTGVVRDRARLSDGATGRLGPSSASLLAVDVGLIDERHELAVATTTRIVAAAEHGEGTLVVFRLHDKDVVVRFAG